MYNLYPSTGPRRGPHSIPRGRRPHRLHEVMTAAYETYRCVVTVIYMPLLLEWAWGGRRYPRTSTGLRIYEVTRSSFCWLKKRPHTCAWLKIGTHINSCGLASPLDITYTYCHQILYEISLYYHHWQRPTRCGLSLVSAEGCLIYVSLPCCTS